MSQIQKKIMHQLYGRDIWEGYEPIYVEDKVQGWNGTHPSLGKLASTKGTKIVMDVGVWKGESTINMALAMKSQGLDAVVIAIDTFLGSQEHWHRTPDLYQRHHGHPSLYWTFLSNVARAGLTDYIIPVPQTSTTAFHILKKLGIKANVIHIDAAHEYREVLRDAEDYWEILDNGGYLIGDDYGLTWSGVVKAAGEFSAKVCQPLAIHNMKWILQKPEQKPGV